LTTRNPDGEKLSGHQDGSTTATSKKTSLRAKGPTSRLTEELFSIKSGLEVRLHYFVLIFMVGHPLGDLIAGSEGLDSTGRYWKYDGDLQQNVPNGFGTIQWDNGDRFEGYFKQVNGQLRLFI
jgi:hypothetical protein